ncbi:hypothetical protein [Shouchella patagoniensis]|uniref:hypothetical protein n=1 Tax=Shouchella patagoniensis TaxID=228576 RepID=UPI00099544FE|nr:hypothetical protein [Shouchella patagoniensis]
MNLANANVRESFLWSDDNIYDDPQQDAFDTAHVYLYTFYTRRVLERELSFFESGRAPSIKYPIVYQQVIRHALHTLSKDMQDIKHYMKLIHLTVSNRGESERQAVFHKYWVKGCLASISISNRQLKKEVGARVNLYICGDPTKK